MNSDAERYLAEIVGPTIKDLGANPMSKRHAFLACVVTFHTIDYLAFPKSSKERRQSFRGKSPSFALVDRIAHAFKHVKTGQEGNMSNPLLKTDAVIVRPPAIPGELILGLSILGDGVGGLIVIDRNQAYDLGNVLSQTIIFLRSQLAK